MKFWIGVDVGGTNIVCGAVDRDGRVLHTIKAPTDAAAGSAAVLDKISDMCRQVAAELGSTDELAAVGIGTPGLVDPRAGISIYSTNLNWRNVPVAAEISARLGVPVWIDNDVRNYVFGEARYGAGRSFDTVLGLTVGTGIAAAIVRRGELFYGHKAMAGEIGHGPREGIDVPCSCGLTGCLEAVASASGMVREAKRLISQGRDTVLTEWYPGERLADLAAADLSRAMDTGDPLATEVVTRAGTLIGRALEPAVHLISPDVIIVGGGAAMAGERLLGPMREALFPRLLPDFRSELQIRTAELHDDAGIIGSAMSAMARAR
ncbi:ROK family protein [Cohnella pontilimi]|uniref:ROK family protein n=1 Tax=Cohnella pontilimi TaxID=2564100 RepID=A0A4U0F9Q6_9BACL|nr:ROK family protein [Cohnella pontilimi]TJY41503.1 ROK family protein [Cohnella pontilimi]